MAIKKYATLNTLSKFLDNLKNLFATKTEMSAKANKTHSHAVSDISNLQTTLDGKVSTSRTVNGKALSSNITLSASDVGAASSSHTHDDRYYTETEIDSKLSSKANTSHNHNSAYDTKGAAADVQENLNTVSDTLDVHIDNLDIHFTAAERTKLSGIAAGAQVNTITGVKGNSESAYRTGNVNITKANIGLGNVDNTADANKSVKYATSAGSATKATQDSNGNTISSTYETKSDASAKLASAKTYADNVGATIKNDLLNGAGSAYDTLKELGDLIDDNTDAIDALETVAAGKANKTHTHAISDVTNLQSTLNNKSDSNHTHNSIISRGNTQAETETTRPSVNGLSMTQAYSNGYPQNYGNILNLKGQGDGQLLIGWSGTSGAHAPVYVRSKRDVSDAKWSDWAQVYTTAHKPTPTDIGAAASSHTHKVANITDLTATATELNYMDGVTSNVQTQLDGKAASSHNHSASNITSGTLSSDRLPTVPVAKGGTGATTAAAALTNLGITATAAELNKLDGVTATTAELNYVDGVTSNIQTQLNGKSSTSHTHSAAGSSLGFVKSGGDVTISSGVITVNDDSHNHTIANVDNLQTTLNGKEDVISWSAITQGQTWSRICLVKANTGVVGWSGILSVGFTRGNVVGNATFAINASHSNTVYITQLNANKYSTFQIRGVTDSNATNTYIEIYDTANSIASGTNQTMYCKFIPLLGCTVTKYTTFTSGATIPSGYTAGSVLTVDTSGGSMVASKFVGSLSGNASSATKATQDGNSNNIVNTYATKTEVNNTKSNLQTQLDSKAASSHTHNYAGSSSAGGSANSAVKLQTARSIGLGNDFTGSANFDGSGNITISAKHYNASVNSGNKSNYPYHRFAYKGSKASPITGQYNDTDAIFCIRETYNGGGYGVLKVSLRTNNSTTTSQASATWLARYNFALDDVKIGLYNVSGATYVDLYIKVGTYARTTVVQLEGNRSWSLVSSNEVNDTTTSDKKTSTECYVTIENAATTLHNQAYSSIISSVDGGQVNYANSASTATSATTASTCTGNSATATKLSSAKTISLTGDVTGSTSFDGSGNVSITATVADDSHNHIISNVDGLQSALDGKSATSHTHTADNLVQWANALFATASNGGVEYSYSTGSGKNVLTEISNMTSGLHTIYSIAGTTGNPKSDESWRMLVHKTSTTIGWVLAFDAQGSIYSNYQSAAGTFKGWRCIYDADPPILWMGEYWCTDTQTVTPSKALSACRNGWVLVWSDYDTENEKATNGDCFTTVIPKWNPNHVKWSGQSFIAAVPTGLNDSGVITFAGKRLYVHDTKITGHTVNDVAPSNDVCLRAIYEY